MVWQRPDSLRAILDSVFRAPVYRWTERPDPFAILRRGWIEFLGWLAALRDAHPFGYQALLYLLLALVLVLAVRVLWILYHTVKASPAIHGADSTSERTPRTATWFQHHAAQLAASGRYAEAVQADFLALVLALDALKVLHFHPSKTPAEYTRESGLDPAAAAAFRDLVRRLYGYAFARWPCDAAAYAQWRNDARPERYAAAH